MKNIIDKVGEILIRNKKVEYAYYILIYLLLIAITLHFYPIKIGHDLLFHLIRFEALIDAIGNKEFPNYIDYTSINGYGYGSKFFYSDFVLIPFAYIAQYIGAINAYKVLVLFCTILTIVLSYISSYKILKNRYIAFVFSVLYSFSYYRFYDVYNRAAVGESICLTFIPLAVWGMYEIIYGDYKKWYILSISFSMMCLTHVLTPIMVVFVFAIYIAIESKKIFKEYKRFIYLIIATLATVFIYSYQLLPTIEQFIDNQFYNQLSDERAVSFPVIHAEEMKYVIRGLFSGMTYVIPEIAGVGIVITFLIITRIFIIKDSFVKKGDTLAIIGLLCLFVVTPLYPWRVFPFSIINVIQFSWRFYSLATMFLAFAASVYFYSLQKTDKRRYMIGIPFIFVFTTLFLVNSGQVFTNNFKELKTFDKNELVNYGIMGAEFLPSAVPNPNIFFKNRANDSVRVLNSKADIINFERNLRTVYLDVQTTETDQLELPLVYYKGYTAEFNGNKIDVQQSENGLIKIPVDTNGKVKVWFGGTLIQKTSPYISLISIILLIIYIILQNRKKKHAKSIAQNRK